MEPENPRRLLSGKHFWPWAAAFAAAGALDWFLTQAVVTNEVGSEGNPLAASVLARHGWAGLALFKAGLTVLVLGLALAVRRRRPRLAGRLLQAGCVIGAAVVAWHVVVLADAARRPRPALARERTRAAGLDRHKRQLKDYLAKLHELAGEVVRGSRTLDEAAARLDAHAARAGYTPPSLRARVDHPGLSRRACLAAHIITEVGYCLRGNPEKARDVMPRLRAEFARHHADLPPFAERWLPRQDLFAGQETARTGPETRKG